MTQNKNEYAATTRPCPCYSNLPQYGADGCIKGIQAPTPVETVTTTTSNDASQVPVIPPQLLVPNTGNTVSVTSAVDLRSNDDSATTDDVTEETRAALLVEVADAYGDQFRYGASSGAEFVPLEEDLDEATEDIEVVPADLLDELAASVANA